MVDSKKRTDLEESFHRVALKYWKKGTTYSFEKYITRRALAFLDWNENHNNSNYTNKKEFQGEIGDRFHKFFKQRSRAPLSPNNKYKVQQWKIVNYHSLKQ